MLFKNLMQRAKSEKETHLCKLIIKLFKENEFVTVERNSNQTKKYSRVAFYRPSFFNIYLEAALEADPTLKKAITEGKLFALAKDILLICDSNKRLLG